MSINISGYLDANKELNAMIHDNPCSVYGCSTNSMLKCHICRKDYCFGHLNLDLHNLKNIGTLTNFRRHRYFEL